MRVQSSHGAGCDGDGWGGRSRTDGSSIRQLQRSRTAGEGRRAQCSCAVTGGWSEEHGRGLDGNMQDNEVE